MAFMAMKKNLDERARKKAFDEIFEKFDRNKNGTMYAKDFVREINNQGIKPDEEELRKICRIADSSGKITKADFEKYSRDSEIFKRLDKNKDGHVSVRELTSKAELAFKALDKDKDGFITKEEFSKIHSTMSPKQVKRVMERLDHDGDGKLDFEEFQKFIKPKKK